MIGRKVVCLFAITLLLVPGFLNVSSMEVKESSSVEEMATGDDRFLIIGSYTNVITNGDGKPGALLSPENKLFIIGVAKNPDDYIFDYTPYCRFAKEIYYVNSCLTGFGVPTQTGSTNSETGESGFIIGYCTEVYFIMPN